MNSNGFQIGQTYWTRSTCDYDTIFSFTVVARTAKFITIADGGKTWRVGVKNYDGTEYAMPYGSYSMAPQIASDRMMAVAA